MRPRRLVVVTGTGTEVGKTWVAAETLGRLRARGATVAARKPAQSFVPGEGPTDADFLAAASGEEPADVCPTHRWYEVAMAPPMAAMALGRTPPTLAVLVQEIEQRWPARPVDVGLVEGAGGLASPQALDGDTGDLVAALSPDLVVVVAPSGLGVLHSVRLCVRSLGDRPVVAHLNRYRQADELHRRNRDWLRRVDGLQVTTSAAVLARRIGPGRLDGTPRVRVDAGRPAAR
jgi:dethiobiotin synthetase